ncbi:MAG: SPFH domain-containing protein [Acidobacteriota bacterium]|nr:SPFH domain-containing protein [Acidobacteriota bacterium]
MAITEKQRKAPNGILVLVILLVFLGLTIWSFVGTIQDLNRHDGSLVSLVGHLLVFAFLCFLMAGLFTVNPNEGKVLQLFGRYTGTVRHPGLRWANPFYTKRRVSLRVRNFETGKLKVNDQRGNPIEIAAVVVWKVTDTAEAVFEVDDFENYVHVQSEAALRSLATAYPYDVFDEGEVSLVSHGMEISERLRVEIHNRLEKAGVKVVEARMSHLAYSPEIAGAMLQRQQAAAVIAARKKIVEGAVGMVDNAIELLSQQKVLELDEERKAAMVSNLLVVLCSDTRPQPVVNAGTLYGG